MTKQGACLVIPAKTGRSKAGSGLTRCSQTPLQGLSPWACTSVKLVLEALKSWVHWGDDDRLLPEIKILIEKFNAILAGDDAPEEREPEQAKRCLNDTDCTEDETCYKGQCQPQRTHGRFGNLEFDEALQRL